VNQWVTSVGTNTRLRGPNRPLRPQHIIPILYKRCTADLGLVSCATTDASSYSGADSFTSIGVCGDDELLSLVLASYAVS